LPRVIAYAVAAAAIQGARVKQLALKAGSKSRACREPCVIAGESRIRSTPFADNLYIAAPRGVAYTSRLVTSPGIYGNDVDNGARSRQKRATSIRAFRRRTGGNPVE